MVPRESVVRCASVCERRRVSVVLCGLREHGHRYALAVAIAGRTRNGTGYLAVVGRSGKDLVATHVRPRTGHSIACSPLKAVYARALPSHTVTRSHVRALRQRQVCGVISRWAHEPGFAKRARLQRAIGPLPTVAALARIRRGAGTHAMTRARNFPGTVGYSRDDVPAIPSSSLQ